MTVWTYRLPTDRLQLMSVQGGICRAREIRVLKWERK